MPLTQPHQKLSAIRRQFSHLSSSSRPKCDLVPTSKSVSPPLIDQTSKLVDSNENRINSPSEFELGANLEAYKKRCRALETENSRLMDNQGKIIAESNRRIGCHLEEIRCLKEQMDAQRRTNGELLRWAQLAEEEGQRAKELSREWQKLGQCNNQLMKKELHSHQLQMNQLEAKTAQLAAENRELKRLCLYLDEQRQAFWRELSSGQTTKCSSTHANSAHCPQFAMGSGRSLSEDAGCCRDSSVGTDSSAECVDSQLEGVVGPMGKGGAEKRPKANGAIQMEEVLNAICTELGIPMRSSVEEQNDVNESGHHSLICAPKIIANGTQMDTAAAGASNCANLHPLSNSTMMSNCPSVASIAHYGGTGFSFPSTDDPTAVVVDHELDETEDGGRTSKPAAEQSLKVHELHPISEEEDKADGTQQRLNRLEQLSRKLALEERDDDETGCSSMVAETGSMFASMLMHSAVDHPLQKQQMIEVTSIEFKAFGGGIMAASADVVSSHRNSTGSSSTSSGAFSGISRCTAEEDGDGEAMEAMEEGIGNADDDLPPRMPLIASFHKFPSDQQRSSSSMAVSVTDLNQQQQQILQRQSSTLPRTPLLMEPQQKSRCAYDQRKKSTDSRKGKSSQQMPVRIRVRPPPIQLLNIANGEAGQQKGKAKMETHEQLIGMGQRNETICTHISNEM